MRFSIKPLVVAAAAALVVSPPLFANATLDVNSDAAMEGTQGLEVLASGVGTSGAYVQDDSPNSETVYRASFLFDPNAMQITLTGNIIESRHFIFTANGTSSVSANVRNIGVYLLRKSGQYFVAATAKNTSGANSRVTPKISLCTYGTSCERLIEVEWQVASGPGIGDGIVRIRVDGGAWAENTTVKSFTQVIERARMGIVIGLDFDTVGSHYFDDFQSFRTLAPTP